MSENGTASCNPGRTVHVREEERNVNEDVTDYENMTASTAVPTTKDNASGTDENPFGEDVTQGAQEGLRLMISRDETGGNERHQPEQPFQ